MTKTHIRFFTNIFDECSWQFETGYNEPINVPRVGEIVWDEVCERGYKVTRVDYAYYNKDVEGYDDPVLVNMIDIGLKEITLEEE
ncbi:MAG: hypothetical protein IJA72_03255 [Clostridia bacterium]|nr:hypothetical protein [Clostridia bacterium]